jgi:alkanesulfonate monooxygenase SsuD/methylene tetrahydromethanopterin reductase-like flavin-dependent oxidoreductase (luciferase family)
VKGLRFGLWYDFRNPVQWARDSSDLYQQVIDQVVRAEELGWDDAWLSEHHFIDDGYLPSCLPVAAAIAAKTHRIRIGTAVAQLPLHDPVRFAEDAAVVDVISRGRLDLGVGLGYRPEEYEGFEVDWRSRVGRFEEAVAILRTLFAGGALDFAGQHYRLRCDGIRPLPVQRPLRILIGGISDAALRRAARLADGVVVNGTHDGGAGIRVYREELEKLGRNPDECEVVYFEQWLVVARDPEVRLREAAAHIDYQMTRYGAWARGEDAAGPGGLGPEELRGLGVRFVRPEEAREYIDGVVAHHAIDRWISWTVPPGLPIEWSDEHVELMAREVLPAFR